MGHALVVALTYNEETEHSRRSARIFDYRDIQELMWSVRRQVKYHLKRAGVVSFIAAGEMGERLGRCHWHLCLFSEVDLLQLGKWSASFGPVSDRREIITPPGAKPRRRVWSLWKHGYVTVQEPDYGGFRYALAYALKDQFNVRKAAGTAREARAEVFSAGHLMMSKQPMIGARWVDSYLAELAEGGIVPPNLQLSVNGLDRPYWPTGLLAERLLRGFALINAEHVARHGVNCAGWSTLLHECRDVERYLKALGVWNEPEGQEGESEALHRFRSEDKPKVARWAKSRRDYQASAPPSPKQRGWVRASNSP